MNLIGSRSPKKSLGKFEYFQWFCEIISYFLGKSNDVMGILGEYLVQFGGKSIEIGWSIMMSLNSTQVILEENMKICRQILFKYKLKSMYICIYV